MTTGLLPYLTLTIDATDAAQEHVLLRADIRHLHSNGPTADAPAAMLRRVNGGQIAVPVAHVFPVAAGRQTFALRVAVRGQRDTRADL